MPNLSIRDKQQVVREEFSFFDDWTDKYKYIIDLGKEAPPFPEEHRKDDNKVKGCQSQVWLHAEYRDGKIYFEGDSDALIVKGLVALLLSVYSGHSSVEILAEPPVFIDDIGLSTNLSPTRSNGLAAVMKQIRNYAIAFQALKN